MGQKYNTREVTITAVMYDGRDECALLISEKFSRYLSYVKNNDAGYCLLKTNDLDIIILSKGDFITVIKNKVVNFNPIVFRHLFKKL
jgi:hypothetical protein